MSAARKKSAVTPAVMLAAVVFAVVGIVFGYMAAWGNFGDGCDRYGIVFAGSVAYDCKRRDVK
jgi:hypothetical protein